MNHTKENPRENLNKSPSIAAYKYIDVAFGSVANRNNIITIDSLPEYIRKWRTENHRKPIDCYKTYFLYSDEMISHVNNEKSVRGFAGSCWSKIFPIDIDSENLIESQDKAKSVLIELRNNFGVNLKNIKLYFSGAKGFHIEIPSKLFGGFIPSPRLNKSLRR